MSINYDVILSPMITEKATRMTESNQVVFRVTLDATKPAIAKAVVRPVQGQGQGREHDRRQGQEEGGPRQGLYAFATSRKRS